MRVAIFTIRSVGIGMATGMIVAALLGLFLGAAWGLAILNGLAAGALGLAFSVARRDARFGALLFRPLDTGLRLGVGVLTYTVILCPMFFLGDFVDERALTLLFGLTAFAAFTIGGMAVSLAHLDGDPPTLLPQLAARTDVRDTASGRSFREDRMRVAIFTTRSPGIGMATGVVVAAVVGPFLGAAWGLAVLNGLAAGALVLAFSVALRDARFVDLLFRPIGMGKLQVGVWALTCTVILFPMFFVDDFVDDIIDLGSADKRALTLLFPLTAFAAFTIGGMAASLAHLDGDDAGSDPHPYR